MNTLTIYSKKLGVLFDLLDFLCMNRGSVTILSTSQDGLYKDETMPSVTVLTQLELEDFKEKVAIAKSNLKESKEEIYVCEENDWE